MSKRDTDRGQAEEIDRDTPLGGEAVTAGSVAQHTPGGLKQALDEEPLLDDNEDIPLGGEGGDRASSIAEHTPARYKKPLESEEPLLGDGDDIPLGGEGAPVVASIADHSPAHLRRATGEEPLLDH